MSKTKNYKRAIVYLNQTEVYCGEKQLQRYVASFRTNRVSWFLSKEETFNYIKKDLSRKKKIFITKGYKHPYVYEVWFNE
jgi:hypothetical protein